MTKPIRQLERDDIISLCGCVETWYHVNRTNTVEPNNYHRRLDNESGWSGEFMGYSIDVLVTDSSYVAINPHEDCPVPLPDAPTRNYSVLVYHVPSNTVIGSLTEASGSKLETWYDAFNSEKGELYNHRLPKELQRDLVKRAHQLAKASTPKKKR